MGGKSFRVIFGLGLLAAVAWSTPACSGSDESGGGGTSGSGAKGGGGGKGATGGTTTGGSSGSGGGADAAPTSITCGSATCQGSLLPALLQSVAGGATEVPPCCSANTKCGLDVSLLNTLLSGLNVDPTCQEKHQAGSPGGGCAEFDLSGATGYPIDPLPGCCKQSTGKCGYIADTISAPSVGITMQLDLGCVDSTPFLNLIDAGPPQACGDAGAGTGGTGGTGIGEHDDPRDGAGGTAGTSSDASTDTSSD